jgi:predicted regulator of Ras-like GTPase activity (Roadblock/LC7/MglB family)
MSSNDRLRRPTTASGIIHFSGEVLERMDEALDALLAESRAKCVFVIDRTGCILSSAGDFHPLAPETMAAVAAGVIAALNTMVSRATSPEVSIRFYGGEIDKIHYMLLGDRIILCMLHSRQTSTGQIRTAAKAFSIQVVPLIESDKASIYEAGTVMKSVQYIEAKLNDLFKDAN